jgi:hypothetical protein
MFSGKITQKACKLPQIGFKLAQIVMFSGFWGSHTQTNSTTRTMAAHVKTSLFVINKEVATSGSTVRSHDRQNTHLLLWWTGGTTIPHSILTATRVTQSRQWQAVGLQWPAKVGLSIAGQSRTQAGIETL